MLAVDQIERYARHIMLPEIGGAGQQRLASARVLVVGAGGLGTPLLLYLAAAGVGTIGVADDDVVELSNLQRQVIHDTDAVGTPKVDSAAARLRAVNPDVVVNRYAERVHPGNAVDLVRQYDLVTDGSDNFSTRFLLADACHLAKRTLVTAALLRFEGQITVSKGYADAESPCYRCLFPAPPPPGLVPNCAEAGVLGALAGMIGSIQAVEVIKELLGIGEGLSGRLLLVDALYTTFDTITVRADPLCPLCGDTPTITDLSAHHHPTP